MIRDPEDFVERRRERRDPKPEPEAAAVSVLDVTMRMLTAERADDPTFLPRAWLARHRGDRRSFEAIAADDEVDIATVRAAIDRALRAEGSSLAEFEESQKRRRGAPGRATNPFTDRPQLQVVR